jgi:hypothetical protein
VGVIFAAAAGCLCSLEPGWVPGHTVKQNWQNGAIACDYEAGTQVPDPHLILIERGTALLERFAYRGDVDLYYEELRDVYTPWPY